MHAGETKLQPMIEGTKQYVVPLFQRPYSWEKKEWKMLWDDLVDLCEAESPRPHFFGSIVTMPTASVPEGVTKYLLIDGQQRLTTTFILLALIRNIATTKENKELAEEVQNTLLVNPYKTGNDFFKLQPTQGDREVFHAFINSTTVPEVPEKASAILLAYRFFERQLKKKPLDIEKLKSVICRTLSAVSIVLEPNDNPHLVFEGLNAKGRPLTQADLIRNYFVMRVHTDVQEQIYDDYWRPMQEALGASLTEFIRHYLMREGAEVKLTDVYFVLKDEVTLENAIAYLKGLATYAQHYEKLLFPDREENPEIRAALDRIRRLEVGVSYPFLLKCYEDYAQSRITREDFLATLGTIENFMVRRFVCNVPTYGLNRVFAPLYTQIKKRRPKAFIQALKDILETKGYPKDYEFSKKLVDAKLYGAGDRVVKTKLILEGLELSYPHKERVPLGSLTVEHIMPQTLDQGWQGHLGDEWQIVHELYLHTLGNLTLTAYNPDLSNKNFDVKKPVLAESHLELNGYFESVPGWRKDDIERRSLELAAQAVKVWPYFGSEGSNEPGPSDVVGTSPSGVWILGQRYDASSWRDVLERTMTRLLSSSLRCLSI